MNKQPDPAYRVESVDAATFTRDLHPDLAPRDYDWAFARGDSCVVSYFHDQIVGWDFSTDQPTRVVEGVVFDVPEGYYYGYAAFTHPDHRGKGLADQRGVWWDEQPGEDESSSVWYIETSNTASLAAFGYDNPEVEFVGHTWFLKLGKLSFCWRDKACSTLGAGFSGAVFSGAGFTTS